MKKVLTFSLATLAALAFTAGSSFACGGASCSAAKKDGKLAASTTKTNASATDGKLASSSKSCSAAKNGKLASSANGCSAHKAGTKATNASYANLPVNAQTVAAGHDAHCGLDGSCQLVNISVTGMTCDGCAYGVKDALAKIDGVNAVLNVDYKEGIAQVCCNSTANRTAMTKAVTSAGFTAQIIPAVAKTTTKSSNKASLANGSKSAGCSATCSAAKGSKASAKTKTTTKKDANTSAKGDTY